MTAPLARELLGLPDHDQLRDLVAAICVANQCTLPGL
jgi:hypothetical protein